MYHKFFMDFLFSIYRSFLAANVIWIVYSKQFVSPDWFCNNGCFATNLPQTTSWCAFPINFMFLFDLNAISVSVEMQMTMTTFVFRYLRNCIETYANKTWVNTSRKIDKIIIIIKQHGNVYFCVVENCIRSLKLKLSCFNMIIYNINLIFDDFICSLLFLMNFSKIQTIILHIH